MNAGCHLPDAETFQRPFIDTFTRRPTPMVHHSPGTTSSRPSDPAVQGAGAGDDGGDAGAGHPRRLPLLMGPCYRQLRLCGLQECERELASLHVGVSLCGTTGWLSRKTSSNDNKSYRSRCGVPPSSLPSTWNKRSKNVEGKPLPSRWNRTRVHFFFLLYPFSALLGFNGPAPLPPGIPCPTPPALRTDGHSRRSSCTQCAGTR